MDPAQADAETRRGPDVSWSQDPSIRALRSEMSTIRGLLETQLSGLAWGELGKRKPLRAALVRKLAELQLSDVLIVVDGPDENLLLAARNLYRVDVRDASQVDPVSLMAFDKVLISSVAVKRLEARLA